MFLQGDERLPNFAVAGHTFLGVTRHGNTEGSQRDHFAATLKKYEYNDEDHSAALHRMFGSS